MVILVALLVVSNFIFIPIYGITGAALASALSFFVYNLLKFLYLNINFKLKPYNLKILIILIVSVVVYYLQTLIPQMDPFWLDIIIRSLAISILYLSTVYFLNVSVELNSLVRKILYKIKPQV